MPTRFMIASVVSADLGLKQLGNLEGQQVGFSV
jgi:hypothetical protein